MTNLQYFLFFFLGGGGGMLKCNFYRAMKNNHIIFHIYKAKDERSTRPK